MQHDDPSGEALRHTFMFTAFVSSGEGWLCFSPRSAPRFTGRRSGGRRPRFGARGMGGRLHPAAEIRDQGGEDERRRDGRQSLLPLVVILSGHRFRLRREPYKR